MMNIDALPAAKCIIYVATRHHECIRRRQLPKIGGVAPILPDKKCTKAGFIGRARRGPMHDP